jgi:hypothetical protein
MWAPEEGKASSAWTEKLADVVHRKMLAEGAEETDVACGIQRKKGLE